MSWPHLTAPRPWLLVTAAWLVLGVACGGRVDPTAAVDPTTANDDPPAASAPRGKGGAPTAGRPSRPAGPGVPVGGTVSGPSQPTPDGFGGTSSPAGSGFGGAGGTDNTGGALASAGAPPRAEGGAEPDGAGGEGTDCLRCNAAFSQSSLNVCPSSRARWQATQACLCASQPLGCGSECALHAMCSLVDGGGFTPDCGNCFEQKCLDVYAACGDDL